VFHTTNKDTIVKIPTAAKTTLFATNQKFPLIKNCWGATMDGLKLTLQQARMKYS
jgi:hypothetical protein